MRRIAFFLFACAALAQNKGLKPHYDEVYYPSGNLRIEAYLYKPAGNGPFPVVIYNHGSRAGREKSSTPFPFIGTMMTQAGYVVLVPERRGYGRSDGPVFADTLGADRGPKFVERMQEETGDVLAALDYLKTLPYADSKRIAIMGWSLGGIVTVFAASRSDAFRAAVDQAGASLTWDSSPDMQKALIAASATIRAPVLAMVARNDRTTKAVETVAQEVKRHGGTSRLIVYPNYKPPQPTRVPGHAIFAAQGAYLWRNDVLTFLAGAFAAK